jgi:hypothetical protein
MTDTNTHQQFINLMRIFLEFCQEELSLNDLPKIKWSNTGISNESQPSFGGFTPKNASIKIEVLNRHPLDICRTLAHELVHYKQLLNDEINPNSGETGSKEENRANSVAGIIMRKFGKIHPEFYSYKPITHL